ncbi:uncharacterized protein [Littorina saxatilis]|uniref:uncharacterized protein isoform X2 n=1 Tax=Littorina saxatilis TaxID=31220 RepID=UPI0038B5E497
MADREGQVTMADTQVKSLVSEQYLDGWTYDDEDSDEGVSLTSQQSASNQQTKPGSHSKRQHSEVDKASGDSKSVEKKFCMSMVSKSKDTSKSLSVNTGGQPPPSSGKISMSLGASSASKKIAMNVGPSAVKAKAVPIKMNLASQSKTKDTSNKAPSVKQSSAVAHAFGSDSDERDTHSCGSQLLRKRSSWVLRPSENHRARVADEE